MYSTAPMFFWVITEDTYFDVPKCGFFTRMLLRGVTCGEQFSTSLSHLSLIWKEAVSHHLDGEVVAVQLCGCCSE